jgi:hypothetical protein
VKIYTHKIIFAKKAQQIKSLNLTKRHKSPISKAFKRVIASYLSVQAKIFFGFAPEQGIKNVFLHHHGSKKAGHRQC